MKVGSNTRRYITLWSLLLPFLPFPLRNTGRLSVAKSYYHEILPSPRVRIYVESVSQLFWITPSPPHHESLLSLQLSSYSVTFQLLRDSVS